MSNALSKLGTVGIGIALARILGPHAFGTYAVAYVALIAVLSFNELGVSLAIVRWQGEPSEIAPTVTFISLATSIAIYIGCFVGAAPFAAAMGAPAATVVIRVLALNVVIDGAVSTPAALLQRHFLQDKKAITDQVNCWLGAAVTIALASYGFGAMSLAIGRLAGCLAGGILLVVFSPEPLRLGFDWTKARALLQFGLPLGGASLIVFAVSNVDQLIVGHMLGATALGCYVLAFNLSGWPGNIFSLPVRTVAPAVLSRLQHDRAARSAYFLNVASLLGVVALPVCVLISGSAVPLIGFVYGARWLPAAQALLWLGLLAALRIFFELVYDYFVVLARSRVVLIVQLVWLTALVPALIVGTRLFGIFGAGMAGVAVAAGVVLPWYLIELNSVGIRLRALGARLWLPFVGGGVVALAAMAARKVAPNDLTALVASGVATLIIMGLLIYRTRAVLTLLRPASTEDRAPMAADTVAPVSAPRSRPSEAMALALLLSLARPLPDYRDITGPVPTLAGSPVYRQTIASRNWDPAASGHRRARGGDQPAGADSPPSENTVRMRRGLVDPQRGLPGAVLDEHRYGTEMPAIAAGRRSSPSGTDRAHYPYSPLPEPSQPGQSSDRPQLINDLPT